MIVKEGILVTNTVLCRLTFVSLSLAIPNHRTTLHKQKNIKITTCINFGELQTHSHFNKVK
jgi:hypothetical protein